MADNNTPKLPLSDFALKSEAAKQDRILMTDSLKAHSDAAIEVQDFCSSVIRPLIESLSLNFKTLTQAEYDALAKKGTGTFYIIKEQGKIIRTYIGQNPLTDGETSFRVYGDFWQVSHDGGRNYADILDNSGKKVSAKGDKVMLKLTDSGVQYRYESEPDTKYRELIPLGKLKLKFADLTVAQKEEIRGENVYLQKSETHIQWRIGEDGKWMDLVALSELKGDKGDAAVLRRRGDYIQTKNEAGVWENLYNIREVAGAVEIVNELGEKTDAAVSQKLLTDSLSGLSSSLGGLSNVKTDGAAGDGKTDDTMAIQNAIDRAYSEGKKVYIPAGTYIITRALYVYDGIELQGDGIYNTILKTPFSNNDIAKSYVARDRRGYNTLTSTDEVPALDTENGHNRYYLGDGVVGYYDNDRATNPHHPLYWPDDGGREWKTWNTEREKIESTGRWIGPTGRENYAGGLIKSSQRPGLDYKDYNPGHKNPYGTIHTGIRNVKISDLQINTNSQDRGKDSAIDFQYSASQIPAAIRETYDSSVLNIRLDNLYLFSLGRSGYRATRAVDHTVIGCYVRQTAEQGFYFDGGTSTSITGCYCNSCAEGGYALRGVSYSSITACAADSCSTGYNLYKCKGVSLVSCGSEATRYHKAAEVDEEDPYKGRAFSIRNCNGVTLSSCYTITSHPKMYNDDILDTTDDELDPNWLRSRHVMVMNSENVSIAYCHFKCFERIRTCAYRDENNNKVNCQGGAYDPTQQGSRYWQIQNYLVGAQFEIRGGEENSVHIISGEPKERMVKTSEVRVGNLDILDPGTVVNPLASRGYSTAGRTLSGDDGNGGWTYTDPVTQEVKQISFENFEFIFPINAKPVYGERRLFWEWRNSLVLIRRRTDESLSKNYPTRCMGYVNVLMNDAAASIDWSAVTDDDFSKFKIDIVKDYSATSFIDGSKSFFSYGRFSWQQLDAPVAYEPRIFSPIPALVRDKADGHRIIINENTAEGLPFVAKKAGCVIVGNEKREETATTREVVPGVPLVVLSRERKDEITEHTRMFHVTDLKGKDYLSVYGKGKMLSVLGHKFMSDVETDYDPIQKVDASSVTLDSLAYKVNSIIDRLVAHGLTKSPSTDIIFSLPVPVGYGGTSTKISFEIVTALPLYDFGIAYSSSNASPTINQGKVDAAFDDISGKYVSDAITYGSSKSRFIRLYANKVKGGGSSTRVYSETYILQYNESSPTITGMK